MRSERAVVIGSGFGGLAAAVRLAVRGYRVRLLEALPDAGGCARVFQRAGYTFDAGPTVLTAPYLLDELFALAGRDSRDYFDLVALDPFYRILFEDGTSFDYVGDEERLLAQVAALSPRDVDGYRRLAALAERIFGVGYTQLADRPFHRFVDQVRVLPAMARLGSYRSLYGMVAAHIRDARLRSVFSFEPLLVGGNPLRVSCIYLLIHWLQRKWGVHYARGGTGAVIGALLALLTELGVDVRFGSAVEEILVRHGRVVGVREIGGRTHSAATVVSNADPTYVYSRMLDPRHLRWRTRRTVRRTRQSMGLFVCYLGLRGSLPGLQHHTILFGGGYRRVLREIFRERRLPKEPSLYLHAPSRTDPTMAPPGCETCYVLAPVPNTTSGVDWKAEGPAFSDRVLSVLERRLIPGLRGRVETVFHVTPRYFEHALRAPAGAAFGPEPLLSQSAYWRYHNRADDIDGLYFVGAGTHPGAGVPGVLCSARVLDRLVPEAPGGARVRIRYREAANGGPAAQGRVASDVAPAGAAQHWRSSTAAPVARPFRQQSITLTPPR